jgi:exopolyphosphatase/guanosine-5'-triphosphate,3'-diphosphate pyrophosphatase
MYKSANPGGPLAAIDMGSNSFRLEIGTIHQGQYRRIDYVKENVRLGAGLDGHGHLTEEAMQRGMDCLRRLAARLEGFAPAQVRAVATQTLREARNRNTFLLRAQEALGYPIEVISGREEARLIYAGVEHLQPGRQTRLVVDIGGRSTEMILGRGNKALVAESFAVGCVSLSMRFFPDGKITGNAFRAAQVAAGAELEEALRVFAPDRWQQALGSSGTAGAVSQLLQANGLTDGRITPEALRWCIQRCIAAGHIDELKLSGLKVDRRAVLPGGLAILYTLAAHFGIDELHPAKGALRQGVVIDLQRRLLADHLEGGKDVRDASVADLQQRFAVDTEQARRVMRLAFAFFDNALPDADSPLRSELRWACALHEAGLVVSHHDHHRHSAYLTAHADLAGFSQSQQRRVADLVLAQRGGLRKVEAQLSEPAFAWQVLALRLAVIKSHARGEVNTRALRLAAAGPEARLAYSVAWGEQHPRTLYLLNEEAAVWERYGPLRLVLQPGETRAAAAG